MGKFGKKFSLDDSSIVGATDAILDAKPAQSEQSRVEVAQIPTSEPTLKPQPTVQASAVTKTENGIVVNVPMSDYEQLLLMKLRTRRTLKDLALQAIHEFVERNRIG